MNSSPLGFSAPCLPRPDRTQLEHLHLHHPLHRILSFTNRSIHDIINNPLIKNEIAIYYKHHRQIQRTSDIHDLERQWNPLGLRTQPITSSK